MNVLSKIHDAARPNKSRAYTITEFKHRDEWIAMMLAARDLCPRSKVLLARIALHHNVETGRCDPGVARLVSGTGLSESTVRRRLELLQGGGWISIDKTSGRYRNSILLLTPPTLSDGERVEPYHPSERVQNPTLSERGSQPCQNEQSNPVTADGITTNLTAKKTAKEEDSPPPALDQVDSGHRSQSPSFDIDGAFEQFWGAYPKKKAKAKALQAYRSAFRKGATPDALLSGAMQAAVDFEQDAARRGNATAFQYVPHPATWLNAGRWEDEPATDTYGGSLQAQGHSKHADISLQIASQKQAELEGRHAVN